MASWTPLNSCCVRQKYSREKKSWKSLTNTEKNEGWVGFGEKTRGKYFRSSWNPQGDERVKSWMRIDSMKNMFTLFHDKCLPIYFESVRVNLFYFSVCAVRVKFIFYKKKQTEFRCCKISCKFCPNPIPLFYGTKCAKSLATTKFQFLSYKKEL